MSFSSSGRSLYWGLNHLITLHGFPAARQFSGIDFVTTLPAPITLPFPMVTPARMILPPPIHALSSTVIGKALVLKIVPPNLHSNFPQISHQN